jgi:hypothetical protein
VSACVQVTCLAHRRPGYWSPQFGEWVHFDGWPCEALAGEGTEDYRCRYCGAAVQPDGRGRLLSHVPDGEGWWERKGGAPRDDVWHDGKWSGACPVSPTYRHEDRALSSLTRVKTSGTVAP